MFLIYMSFLALPIVTVKTNDSANKYLSLFLSCFITIFIMILIPFSLIFLKNTTNSFRWDPVLINIGGAIVISAIVTFLSTRKPETARAAQNSIQNSTIIRSILFGSFGGTVSLILILLFPKSIAVFPSLLFLIFCPIASTVNSKFKAISNKTLEIYLSSFIAFILPNLGIYLGICLEKNYWFNWKGFGTMSFIGLFACALHAFLITRNRLVSYE